MRWPTPLERSTRSPQPNSGGIVHPRSPSVHIPSQENMNQHHIDMLKSSALMLPLVEVNRWRAIATLWLQRIETLMSLGPPGKSSNHHSRLPIQELTCEVPVDVSARTKVNTTVPCMEASRSRGGYRSPWQGSRRHKAMTWREQI